MEYAIKLQNTQRYAPKSLAITKCLVFFLYKTKMISLT